MAFDLYKMKGVEEKELYGFFIPSSINEGMFDKIEPPQKVLIKNPNSHRKDYIETHNLTLHKEKKSGGYLKNGIKPKLWLLYEEGEEEQMRIEFVTRLKWRKDRLREKKEILLKEEGLVYEFLEAYDK